MKIYQIPQKEQVAPETGIGQVVLAQNRYLPNYGIEFVADPEGADLIVCHVSCPHNHEVDVLHLHGMYYDDVPHPRYSTWHASVNMEIVKSARQALAITVPTAWVAMSFKRDMRITPQIIPHGIELDDWNQPSKNEGYILWNKNHNQGVCDPMPALDLATLGYDVISTFAPIGKVPPNQMKITGLIPFDKMKTMVRNADIYLATTIETFGIGVLEALASGIPVLGYAWGGNLDLVKHKVNGFLVEPGDIDGLREGIEYIRTHRIELSKNGIETSKNYLWSDVIGQYAELYEAVLIQKKRPRTVSVIITNYNYAKFLPESIGSVLAQDELPSEIIVVDDGSTDNSREVIERFADNNPIVKPLYQKNQGVANARNNGIAMATGEFISCLDADDRYGQGFVRVLHSALEAERDLGIAYSGLALLNERGELTPNAFPPEFDWNKQVAGGIPPSNSIPCCCMFRKSMWRRAGGYRQCYVSGEDAEFWARGLSVGYLAKKVTEEYLFHYRPHQESLSRTTSYKAIDTWHPWMKDHEFPFAAPDKKMPPVVRSYFQPVISVIIPVGPSHIKYLPSALDSILGQTLRNWEVVVVNDTGDKNALNEYTSGTYPFIQEVFTGGVYGAGAARNRGVDAAVAPLSFFLDADDYVAPTTLKNTLNRYVELGGERYIYPDWVVVKSDGTMDGMTTQEYEAMRWLVHPEQCHGITVLMATSDAKNVRFDETMKYLEDSDFFMRCAIMGVCGTRLPEQLLYYRVDLGRRRPRSAEKLAKAKLELVNKFTDYAGGKPMKPCCPGGGGNTLMAAKRALQGLPPDDYIPPPEDAKMARLEYIGDNIGAISFTVSGRTYRGGNNATNKFIDVRPEDVGHLVNTGRWIVIDNARVVTPVTTPLPVKVTATDQPRTEGEKQQLAEQNLMTAKRKAEEMATEADLLDEIELGVPHAIPLPKVRHQARRRKK